MIRPSSIQDVRSCDQEGREIATEIFQNRQPHCPQCRDLLELHPHVGMSVTDMGLVGCRCRNCRMTWWLEIDKTTVRKLAGIR
jgi:hypothetical protein